MMTGRRFGAEEARQVGLVTQVTGEGKHLEAAEKLATTVLGKSQPAVRELVRCRRSILAEHLQHARSVGGTFRWNESPDFQNAIREKAT
jgi:enoyl-CoA hydratase/carnithine racemase